MNPNFTDNVEFVEELERKEAIFGNLRTSLPDSFRKRLPEKLFVHQSEAIDAALNHKDVLVVTGTNSGKSLCYFAPSLYHCLQEPMARAIFLYPTKALAQDQLGRLQAFVEGTGTRVATYDGDTPKSHRSGVRNLANIILTNPDMLHTGIIPSHEHWVKFIKSLRVIAIDELHTYRGIFGSHVALILRRLLRLCEWHGSKPQIIAGSATISNPNELFLKLTGRDPVLIGQDGAPSGKRTIIFFNPPKVSDFERLSPNKTTSEIFSSLIQAQVPTIVFNRSRVGTELVLRQTRARLTESDVEKVESYRGGYTPKERRKIEQSLQKGKLLGISTTNALELGINIGHLDAVVINTYPGSVSSFWQQIGRAGRGEKDALAIFVAGDNPLEQYLLNNPKRLLDKKSESVVIQPENPNLLRSHLLCAAHERPLSPSEIEIFGSKALEIAEDLDRSGELAFRGGRFYYPAFDQPAQKINIRSASRSNITLLLGNEELGSMEYERALSQCYPGAVYLHRGEMYEVEELDLDKNLAHLSSFKGHYYTVSQTQSMIEPGSPFNRNPVASVSGCKVTDLVVSYKKKAFDRDAVLDVLSLEMPPVMFDTVCIRFDLPQLEMEGNIEEQIAAVHALEHSLLSLAPLFSGCDPQDLGSAWFSVYVDTMCPAVFIYDRAPGGIGLSEALFQKSLSWVQACLQSLKQCSCENGCPSCLYLSQCEISNEQLNKQGGMHLLKWLIDRM
jgi:DEAD/DEAH box helicase domain-containing protein